MFNPLSIRFFDSYHDVPLDLDRLPDGFNVRADAYASAAPEKNSPLIIFIKRSCALLTSFLLQHGGHLWISADKCVRQLFKLKDSASPSCIDPRPQRQPERFPLSSQRLSA